MEDWYGRKFKIIEKRATSKEQEGRVEQIIRSNVHSTTRRNRSHQNNINLCLGDRTAGQPTTRASAVLAPHLGCATWITGRCWSKIYAPGACMRSYTSVIVRVNAFETWSTQWVLRPRSSSKQGQWLEKSVTRDVLLQPNGSEQGRLKYGFRRPGLVS